MTPRIFRGLGGRLGGPRPRVEPNYREESVFWSTVSIVLNVVVPLVALLTTLALGLRDTWVLTAVATLASFLYTISRGSQGGGYHLAVEFVNSVDVREWAYCRGVAVALLSDDLAVVLDTRYRRLYLMRWSSLHPYPLPASGRAGLRVDPFERPRRVRLGCLQGRRAEVLRGYVEVPSVRRAGEVAATYGTFVRVRLGLLELLDPKSLSGLTSCCRGVLDLGI
jgi:hypothetical protein